MVVDGENYIVTTNDWFIAPDGNNYRAAWGKCKMFKIEDVFGFTPARPSTNWYLQIGEGDGSIIVAGCQIHYAIKCKNSPDQQQHGKYFDSELVTYVYTKGSIYIAN